MKLDRYDIALTNATVGTKKAITRPTLANVYLHKGNLIAADGYILAIRQADLAPNEKDTTAFLPTVALKAIHTSKQQQAELTIDTERAKVTFKNAEGKALEHDPVISFQPYKPSAGTFPSYESLYSDARKSAHVCVSVSVLKKVLACLPNDGTLRLGILNTEGKDVSLQPIEFECSNMDRPIRGLIMPMYLDWQDFHWWRPAKETPAKTNG